MATHASALKRQRQNEKRKLRNQSVISKLKTLRKKVLSSASKEEALKNLNNVMSALHKASARGVLHRRTASRKISRLSSYVKKIA